MKKILFILVIAAAAASLIFAEDKAANQNADATKTQPVSKDLQQPDTKHDSGLTSAKNAKIGVVNIDRVTLESKSLKSLIKDMENTVKIKQDEMDKKVNEYQELNKKIEQQKEILTKEELDKKKGELSRIKEDVNDLKYEINKMLQRSEKQSIEPALDRILEAIKVVAETQKLDIVMRSDLLLYMNPACDITDKVIAKLDELTEKNPIPLPKDNKEQ